jgi:hypothetical protein
MNGFPVVSALGIFKASLLGFLKDVMNSTK